MIELLDLHDKQALANKNTERLYHHWEQSLSIGETGAEGNEQGYETIAFSVTGV